MMKTNVLTTIVALLAMLVAPLTGHAATEWPDLPLLTITTVNGEEPTATKVYPPDGCFGEGILSEYVPGRLVLTDKGKTVYDSGDYVKSKSGMRLKIRGNVTGANLSQRPYKIKLSKKADLLQLGDEYKSKNFALMSMYTWNSVMKNSESNILLNAGLALCRSLDFPWTPNTRPVNVVINGTYRGLYHLVETVERADNRIQTEDTGFVIENDAYWWKEGETYFQTTYQEGIKSMGYTFKYPDDDDLNDERISAIKGYMEEVENAVYNDAGASDLIDYNSFARWVLGHDILGSYDSAGSNMFLYKESMDGTADKTKLKMATMWDFDMSFATTERWSRQHSSNLFYYKNLFRDKQFVDTYLTLYNQYIGKVYGDVEKSLGEFKTNYGKAFEESMQLHRAVYSGECANTLDEQIDDILTHLSARIDLLKQLVQELKQETSIEECGGAADNTVVKRTDIYGVDRTGIDRGSLPPGIYIEKRADGTVRKVLYR